LLLGGITVPFMLYTGLSLNADSFSGFSAVLMAGIMLAVILAK
jgi:hypothetical protein